MKNLLSVLLLLAAFNLSTAQEVPQDGKKIIKIKTTFDGEYEAEVDKYGLPEATKPNFIKIVTKKLKKYGFNNVTFTEIGTVKRPERFFHKVGDTNEQAGLKIMGNASTLTEYRRGIDKALTPNKNYETNFQMNFIDNITGHTYKLRVSGLRGVRYIIKETSNKGVN